jgi:hypothetical protein
MDVILSSITIAMLRLVEDQLSNNDAASDQELLEYFVASGLSEVQARQALSYRSLYERHIYLDGFTPILKGDEAIRYNPISRKFEPV